MAMASTSKNLETKRPTGDYSFLPGDVIQPYCEPLIKILYNSEREQRCINCFQQNGGNLQRCSSCKKVQYCDRKCQRRDWKESHSMECKSTIFRDGPIEEVQGRVVDPNLVFKILKTIAVLHLHPEKADQPHAMWHGRSKTFNHLMSHEAEFTGKKEYAALCTRMAEHLKKDKSFGVVEKLDAKFLQRIIGIWSTNAFQIMDDTQAQVMAVGVGIYIQPSFFDHSCRPNAVRVSAFPSCAMEIRCIAPIRRGEKPFITYLAGHRVRQHRQMILKHRYNFQCNCTLCESEKHCDATDYELLGQRSQEVDEDKPWEIMYKNWKETMGLFRKLFHEYDERLTNYCLNICEGMTARYKLHHDVPRVVLTNILEETNQRLKITFGPTHTECIRFCEQMQAIGIMKLDGTFKVT